MFAAASGARLAHRHNQATVKKQLGTNNVDGVQVNCKAFEKNQHAKHSNTLGIHGQRKPQKCYQNYTSKPYSSDSESVSKLSSSYVDLHGKIPKFGHVDFEGRNAWQDRELGSRANRTQSLAAPSEAAALRSKQKEAHKRWVKRNRIQDATYGECSSEEEEVARARGVQNPAANALLYIGLGTICVGMIIAFVGTGDKGFKTVELKLIGPCLIMAGFFVTFLRVLLCVCPSKCNKCKRQKPKNLIHKLNNEEEGDDNPSEEITDGERDESPSPEPQGDEILPMTDRTSVIKKSTAKKRVLIAELPKTSTVCERGRRVTTVTTHLPPVEEKVVKRGKKKTPLPEQEIVTIERPYDVCSIGSNVSIPSHIMRTEGGELRDLSRADSIQSDISLSHFIDSDSLDSETNLRIVQNASISESPKSPNKSMTEILLSPSNLNE